MEQELAQLEDKITQITDLCQRLRAENVSLRQQLASCNDENRQLEEKVATAVERLQLLLNTLPADA